MSTPVRAVRSSQRAEARHAREATPRHLQVVGPADRPARRARLWFAIGMTVVGAAVFGLVAFNVFLVQSQFRLEKLEQGVAAERAEWERLRLEVARLKSPDRILQLARDQLHMIEPTQVTALRVAAGDGTSASAWSDPAAQSWAEVKPYLAADP